MSDALGALEDLPPDYLAKLAEQNILPLWPSLRALLPFYTGTPESVGLPGDRTGASVSLTLSA